MKKIHVNCSRCESRLEGRGLFCRVSDEGLKLLDARTSARVYSGGQTLFNEGDVPEGLHCLHKGLVKLCKTSKDGKHGFLRLAKPGYPLGYRAFFLSGVYNCTAVALKESEICFLPSTLIGRLAETEPSLSNSLMKTLADDLTRAEKSWLETTQWSVLRRVSQLLLELEGLESWPPRREMALMLSMTPEVFARTLSSLQDKGYLKRNRRQIKLIDRDLLRKIADGESVPN